MTTGHVLQEKTKKHPNRHAIISKEGTITYADLFGLSCSFANGLLDYGFKKGDRVGVLTRKTPETVIAYLGMGLIGVIGVPLSFHYREERLRQVISATSIRLIVVDEAFMPVVAPLKSQGCDFSVVTIGNNKGKSDYIWNDFLSAAGSDYPDVGIHDDDVFYLNFTSGSTGVPKAVATTHAHIHWNTLSSLEALNIKDDQKHLCMFAVFSHPHEIFARPLWTGGTMVLLDSLYPKSIASMISDHSISAIMGLAPMYEMLLPFANSERYDFSSLTLVESGGMFTHPELQSKFLDNFGIAIRPVWGSTETTGVALAVPQLAGVTRSCGKTAPYYTVKVIDNNGNEVPHGETGEMIIQGPAVVNSYLDDDNETEKCFHDGWFYTGDMVFQDSDDLFYFRGRESGMMKVGGLKVFPQEIEDTIQALNQVEDVAVVPVTEKLRGEVPQAFVVLKEDEILDAQQIKDYCRKNLANYMIPKKIVFRQSLPKTSTGKIDKNVLIQEMNGEYTPSKSVEMQRFIERIDLKLLQLMNERTRVSISLREIKKQNGEPLFSPGEEEETITRILGFNSGPLHDEFVERFFQEFIHYLITL